MTARVAIVGAGVMGCAAALGLRARGVDVVLLERAVPGAEASSAAAGILGAQAESHAPGDAFALFRRAREAYGAWAEELRAASGGIDVGYRRSGVLQLAWNEREHAELAAAVRWQTAAGARAELLEGAAARAIEPELSSRAVAAAYFPDDAQVDPPRLLRALAAAAIRGGVELRSHVTVERLAIEGGRCVGVVLGGETLRADATVLAAGSWSSLVPGVPAELPKVFPARGQMVMLDERPPRVRSIVFSEGAYAVPRGDGRVVCGSTMEMVGFRREVTAEGVRTILNKVSAAVPSLDRATMGDTWCSFRPYIEGGVPQMGSSPLPGLLMATGHHRNGILLAKVTADAVVAAFVSGAAPGSTGTAATS